MGYDEVTDTFYATGRSFLNPRGTAVARTERATMQTIDELTAKRDAALAEADKLQAAIKTRESYGTTDVFKNGTLLKVEMRYPPAKTTYTYAVIKVAGRYWLTGKMQQKNGVVTVPTDGKTAGWTWENFVAWLAQGDATVWRVTDLEQVL